MIYLLCKTTTCQCCSSIKHSNDIIHVLEAKGDNDSIAI